MPLRKEACFHTILATHKDHYRSTRFALVFVAVMSASDFVLLRERESTDAPLSHWFIILRLACRFSSIGVFSLLFAYLYFCQLPHSSIRRLVSLLDTDNMRDAGALGDTHHENGRVLCCWSKKKKPQQQDSSPKLQVWQANAELHILRNSEPGRSTASLKTEGLNYRAHAAVIMYSSRYWNVVTTLLTIFFSTQVRFVEGLSLTLQFSYSRAIVGAFFGWPAPIETEVTWAVGFVMTGFGISVLFHPPWRHCIVIWAIVMSEYLVLTATLKISHLLAPHVVLILLATAILIVWTSYEYDNRRDQWSLLASEQRRSVGRQFLRCKRYCWHG